MIKATKVKSVSVTRVTVTYSANSREFTIDLDPEKVRTIVFDEEFLLDLRRKHAGGSTKDVHFDAGNGIPATVKKADGTLERTNAVPRPAGTTSRASLWWLTEKNRWFHPEEEE